MALIVAPSAWHLAKKPHLHLRPHLLHHPTKATLLSIVKSQDTSSSSSSEPPKPAGDASSSVAAPSPNKQTSTGVGFGSPSSSASSYSAKSGASPAASTKKKQRGKRERASIIRRAPAEKPGFASSQQEEARAKEVVRNESAFLLAWLGLGALILVEGIALAASGFLPEEWDKFFVQYLYPSFTPTVFLFVAGTVVYGVFKYLENEKLKSQK